MPPLLGALVVALTAAAFVACGGDPAAVVMPANSPPPDTAAAPAVTEIPAVPERPAAPAAAEDIAEPAAAGELGPEPVDDAVESRRDLPATRIATGPAETGAGEQDPPPAAADPALPARSDAPGPSAESDDQDVVTVVIDPGHGGADVGAAANRVVERESNLDLALRIRPLLEAAGYRVLLTREDAGTANGLPASPATEEWALGRTDRQFRVDMANKAGAAVFVALHSNGAGDPAVGGVEMWYDPNRPWAEENVRLARLMQQEVLTELWEYGYRAVDRGLKDDTCWRYIERLGRCRPLFVLGEPRTYTRADLERRDIAPESLGFDPGQDEWTTRATQMPAVLAELLFISNPMEAAILRDNAGRDAIARGVAQAVIRFLAGKPSA